MTFSKEKETMVDNNFLSNFKQLFNIELAKRFIAVVFFVPIFLYSLYQDGIIVFFLFIFFAIMVFSELVYIFSLSYFKINVTAYSFLAMFTLAVFPFYYFTLHDNYFTCLYVIISLWIFDTFSFLGGNIFKGKKIFPELSKGKTYSGAISGFITVIIFNIILSNFIYGKIFLSLFALTFIICVLSFIGDLLVSLLKRQSNLKDSGKLFIGHGGFLDRMDSFILVFFFFIILDLQNLLSYA